jgi:acetyl-CoA carboxylase biotin carboxyl carrier protein
MSDNTQSPPANDLGLTEITQIVELMAKNNLSYFQLERAGSNITLRRGHDLEAITDVLAKLPAPAAATVMHAPAAAYAPPSGPLVPAAAAPVAAAPAAAAAPVGATINSPMVGTFYGASEPGAKPFVSVGQAVDANTTVCIIEAMKVMNEIKAEKSGVIARVLVEDGKPVQFGQHLFELQ